MKAVVAGGLWVLSRSYPVKGHRKEQDIGSWVRVL